MSGLAQFNVPAWAFVAVGLVALGLIVVALDEVMARRAQRRDRKEEAHLRGLVR